MLSGLRQAAELAAALEESEARALREETLARSAAAKVRAVRDMGRSDTIERV